MTSNNVSVTYAPVSITRTDEKEHRREIATKLNSVNQGKFNVALEVSLNANAAATTVTDARLTNISVICMMPVTLHAAQDISSGALYIPESTMLNGSCVIQHQNNAFTDRNFRIGIFG